MLILIDSEKIKYYLHSKLLKNRCPFYHVYIDFKVNT